MNGDRYKSLITRQFNAIQRAEWQIDSFHRCFAALDATGQKVAEPQIAAWLQANGVKCSRKKAQWTPKTVGDRLYIDQRLKIDEARRTGMFVVNAYRDMGWDDKLVQLQKWLCARLPTPADTIEQCIDMMADITRVRVDKVAIQIRQRRTFLE